MYQAIGMETNKVYARGTKADCLRKLNKKYPFIVSEKSDENGWGRGNIATGKPIFSEPIRIVKINSVVMGSENS